MKYINILNQKKEELEEQLKEVSALRKEISLLEELVEISEKYSTTVKEDVEVEWLPGDIVDFKHLSRDEIQNIFNNNFVSVTIRKKDKTIKTIDYASFSENYRDIFFSSKSSKKHSKNKQEDRLFLIYPKDRDYSFASFYPEQILSLSIE